MTDLINTTLESSAVLATVTYSDVVAAAQRLAGNAHHMPIMSATTLNQLTQSQVFLKCENFQRAGTFKFHGAFNALAQLSTDHRQQGVLTGSSGNHAQVIALTGQILHIPTTVIMLANAPAVKPLPAA